MRRLLLTIVHDLGDALQRVLPAVTLTRMAAVLVGTLAGWWLFVPLHELSHAFGCLAAGGTVQRLEISPEYGAAWLAEVFPFVAVGSDYAGQLVGFDTGGSDLTYLVTVFAPYLWTILVGVPLLRFYSRRGRDRLPDRLLFGAAVPVAYASFVNLPGDFYELGSIVVSRVAVGLGAAADPERWRSDDVFRLAADLFAEGPTATDAAVVALSLVLGILMALATYGAGRSLERLAVRRGAPRGDRGDDDAT